MKKEEGDIFSVTMAKCQCVPAMFL